MERSEERSDDRRLDRCSCDAGNRSCIGSRALHLRAALEQAAFLVGRRSTIDMFTLFRRSIRPSDLASFAK